MRSRGPREQNLTRITASIRDLLAGARCVTGGRRKPDNLIVGGIFFGGPLNRFDRFQRRRGRNRSEVYGAISRIDCSNVVLRLEKRRYAIAVKLNRALSRVVARERKSDIAAESIKQPPQIS